MKTSNVNQGRAHHEAIIRGWVSPRRAGSSGINVGDGTTDLTGITGITIEGGTVNYNGDGTVTITIDGGRTIPGEVTPDGSPFTWFSGTDYIAFPGLDWLDTPAATEHGIGDRALAVARKGADHLTGGKIVGRIGTVTSTTPWTFSLDAVFDIEDVANDLRPQGDPLSVLDIGGGDYRAVIWADEFDGTNNISPHVLVCDDSSSSMTSTSGWTRHNVGAPFSGHTQDAANGRVHQLADGTYMMAGQYYVGATSTVVVLSSADLEDWSSPTMTTVVASGYNECDFEEVYPGTLIAHLRETASVNTYSSTSTDSGATWTTPALLFAGGGYPTWRVLNSGLGLTVYRNMGANFHAAWRQTQTGVSDTGWGAETILDSTGFDMEYATILQLDNTHVLVMYAVQATSGAATDCDIYSQVFTDSSIIATVSNAPDDADYLIGTADPDLPSAIVVGTTPGGELGGTWPSPTVDTTHSGSSHAATQAAAEATAAAALAAALASLTLGGQHAHVASETHLSDGSTGTYTLDQTFEPGSVIAWNVTSIARLTVTEIAPDQATVSPVGSSGDSIVFDYAASIA